MSYRNGKFYGPWKTQYYDVKMHLLHIILAFIKFRRRHSYAFQVSSLVWCVRRELMLCRFHCWNTYSVELNKWCIQNTDQVHSDAIVSNFKWMLWLVCDTIGLRLIQLSCFEKYSASKYIVGSINSRATWCISMKQSFVIMCWLCWMATMSYQLNTEFKEDLFKVAHIFNGIWNS